MRLEEFGKKILRGGRDDITFRLDDSVRSLPRVQPRLSASDLLLPVLALGAASQVQPAQPVLDQSWLLC